MAHDVFIIIIIIINVFIYAVLSSFPSVSPNFHPLMHVVSVCAYVSVLATKSQLWIYLGTLLPTLCDIVVLHVADDGNTENIFLNFSIDVADGGGKVGMQ